jgi:hypothetical protein
MAMSHLPPVKSAMRSDHLVFTNFGSTPIALASERARSMSMPS